MTDTGRRQNGSAPTIDGCPLDRDPATVAEAHRVVDLMTRYGVSCGNLGGHTAPGLPRHHHHDMTCLIEAGSAEPLRKLAKAEARIEHTVSERDELMRENRNFETSIRSQRLLIQRLRSYIDNTPDPSKDGSVGDHFRDWINAQDQPTPLGQAQDKLTPERVRAVFEGPDLQTQAGMAAMFGARRR